MQRLTFIKVSFLLSIALCAAAPAFALDVERKEVRQFIDRMVEEHDYDRDALTAVLQQAESQQSILEAISRPAEKTKAWYEIGRAHV